MPPYTTLIDTATLASLVSDPRLAIVDCRFELAAPAAGEAAYQRAHIPGAVYAHLDRDLSGTRTAANGRHPLPSPEALTGTLGRLGIDGDTQVVAYDQDSGMFASRLWWLLRWMGHDRVAVLDGGFARWTAEGRATESGVAVATARRFASRPRPEMIVDAAGVEALIGSPTSRIVDARAPERYRGDVEPIDPVAGHIPGAVNHFFMRNLDQEGLFKRPAALRVDFSALTGDADAAQVVCYCGSGVTACHNLLALEHAGLPGARLFPGSWSEWLADSRRPIERG